MIKIIQDHLKLFDSNNVVISDGQYDSFAQFMLKNCFESRIVSCVNDFALASERLCPGSFKYVYVVLEHLLRADVHGEFITNLVRKIAAEARRPDYAEILGYIDGEIQNTSLANAAKIAFDIAGVGGKIIIRFCDSDVVFVEKMNGFNFDIEPCIGVARHDRLDVIPIVIDGFVESVGEINKIFVDANELHTPIALFVRGMNADVISTIKLNNSLKKFDIIPYIVQLNESTIFVLNDIAAVCGVEVVSSDKSQLINSIDIREYNRVSKMLLSRNLTIVNGTNHALEIYVKNVKQKMHDCQTVLKKMYEDRLRMLIPNFVTIGCSKRIDHISREKFDNCIKTIPAILSCGFHDSDIDRKFAEIFHGEIVALRKITSIVYARKAAMMLTRMNENSV